MDIHQLMTALSEHSNTVIALVVLLCFSAYFSASETAFTSANKARLKTAAREGDHASGRALKLLGNYDRLLYTTLIGNNIVNILSASLATTLFVALFPKSGVWLSSAVMTVLVLIFGEITPKSLAKQQPEALAAKVAPSMKFLTYLLMPLNVIFTLWRKLVFKVFKIEDQAVTTEDELITIVDEAEAEGGIGALESDLIRSAIEFNDLDVNDILTPRVEMAAIEDCLTVAEAAQEFYACNYSRLPVYRDSVDNIIGILHEKDLVAAMIRGEESIIPLIQPVIYASQTMKISALLRQLQKNKSHMAIVLDEFGGTEGLVTLEDIIEELVGEIWDEHDEVETPVRQIAEDTFVADGSADIAELFDVMKIDERLLEDADTVTVSGWVMEQFGHIPQAGETVTVDRMEISVLKAGPKLVEEAQFRLVAEAEEEDY